MASNEKNVKNEIEIIVGHVNKMVMIPVYGHYQNKNLSATVLITPSKIEFMWNLKPELEDTEIKNIERAVLVDVMNKYNLSVETNEEGEIKKNEVENNNA